MRTDPVIGRVEIHVDGHAMYTGPIFRDQLPADIERRAAEMKACYARRAKIQYQVYTHRTDSHLTMEAAAASLQDVYRRSPEYQAMVEAYENEGDYER